MPDFLTTAQWIILFVILAVLLFFWAKSIFATINNDTQSTLRYFRAMFLLLALAVVFVLLSIATNNNFNPFSLLQ